MELTRRPDEETSQPDELEALAMDLAEHGGLRYAEWIDISAWSGRGPTAKADPPGEPGAAGRI